MVKKLLLIIVLPIFCHISYGLKILNVFPTISKSHNILGEGVNMHLLNAGHEVTYITPFPKNNPHPRLREINVSANFDMLPKERTKMSSLQSGSVSHEIILLFMHLITVRTLENENVQKLINDPTEHFDLVICDWMFNEITFNGLAKLYGAPLIWVTSLEPHWIATKSVDEALNPAYSSDFISSNELPFTFWQRVQELWYQLKVTFYTEVVFQFFDARIYNRLIAPIMEVRGIEPPSSQDLRYNASLVISNSHVSFGEAQRLPINYIPLAGYHINDDVKSLPEDIKKIMDNAKDGVIYFSMGSLIQSKDLPDEVKQSLVTMFGTLKQTVIWKFEESLSNLPNNLHIMKWAPQQSILAHPNCFLFITHGGLLSTTEAIHYSVPIVGIPVFADQYKNIDKAVSKGIARRVELTMVSAFADDLKTAIYEVLSNPKYKKKVNELSFIYHHRPVKPGVELIHWIEHVVKTRGAPHMRSLALMLPWYQKMYLDLIALIVLSLVFIWFVYKKIIRVMLFKKNKTD